MAVYIDEALWEWRGKKWCHLLADSLKELHEFALQLGLKPEWFQYETRFPHYDITENFRNKALALGAFEVDRKTIITKARILRDQYHKQIRRSVYDNAKTNFNYKYT